MNLTMVIIGYYWLCHHKTLQTIFLFYSAGFPDWLTLVGGDLFERVAATDYKLTEEKVQILMKQIIKGELISFSTN